MGVFSVFQQMFNFIDIKVYHKKQLNYNTSILTMAGTFLYIYTPCPDKKGATNFFTITFTNMHGFLRFLVHTFASEY